MFFAVVHMIKSTCDFYLVNAVWYFLTLRADEGHLNTTPQGNNRLNHCEPLDKTKGFTGWNLLNLDSGLKMKPQVFDDKSMSSSKSLKTSQVKHQILEDVQVKSQVLKNKPESGLKSRTALLFFINTWFKGNGSWFVSNWTQQWWNKEQSRPVNNLDPLLSVLMKTNLWSRYLPLNRTQRM